MTEDVHDPLAMLKRELAAVAPSPGFASRVRDHIGDELAPLREELSGLSASPEFAARVRHRLASEPQRAEFGLPPGASWLLKPRPRWVIPAMGVAAAAVLMFLIRPVDPPIVSQPLAVGVTQIVAPPASPKLAPPVAASPARDTPRQVRAIARATAMAVTRLQASATPRDPMLDVITDQPARLKQLQSRATPESVLDPTEPAGPYAAPKLEVTPIEVSPLSVFLVPDPRGTAAVLPIIRRIAANSAERSFQ